MYEYENCHGILQVGSFLLVSVIFNLGNLIIFY
jgi:hypothetical protein